LALASCHAVRDRRARMGTESLSSDYEEAP
jgi:hypothetical protein